MEPEYEDFFADRDWTIQRGPEWLLYSAPDLTVPETKTDELLSLVEGTAEEWSRQSAERGQRNAVVESPFGDVQWFLKQYHHGGLLAGTDDVVYQSADRFVESLRATLKASELGVLTPEPRFLLVRSTEDGFQGYQCSRFLPEVRPLSKVIRLTTDQSYLERAAVVLADLHEADIDHQDFHVGNLMVNEEDNVVLSDFDPVDLNELSGRVRDRRVRRFNRSLRKNGFLEEDCTIFAETYYERSQTTSTLLSRLESPLLATKDTVSDVLYWARDRKLEPINLEKVLVRVPNWLGDAVMSLPFIEQLDQLESVGRIDVAARSFLKDLYDCHRPVDKVWDLPDEKGMRLPDGVRSERYSSLFIIPKSFRTGVQAFRSGIPRRIGFATQGRGLLLTDRVPLKGRDRSEHHARLYMRLLEGVLDLPDEPAPPTLSPPASMLEQVTSETEGPFFTIHPGSAYGPAKRWPEKHFSEFLQTLVDRRSESIVAVGVEEERPMAERILESLPEDRVINKVGKTSLLEAMAYLSESRGTVANDSGIMHLSAGLGTPTLGIFGSSDPDLTRPVGDSTDYLYENVECSPCFERECPLETDRYKCLERIESTEALNAFLGLINDEAS